MVKLRLTFQLEALLSVDIKNIAMSVNGQWATVCNARDFFLNQSEIAHKAMHVFGYISEKQRQPDQQVDFAP